MPIDVSFILTDGKSGNEGKNFSFSGRIVDDSGNPVATPFTVNVITSQPARNGGDIESIDSIRYFAPRLYSAQSRAVTPKDYEAIVQDIYPNAESISVVGGEEMDPPQYGNVLISIKPRGANYISDFNNVYINKNIIHNFNIFFSSKKIYFMFVFLQPSWLMVLILNGNSEMGAHL